MTKEPGRGRGLWLLACGAVIGLAFGLLAPALQSAPAGGGAQPPVNAIALVNGAPILEEEYARAVALLAADKRTGLTEEDRRHVLDRLIEEELLVQHGKETGLVDSDGTVRKAITQAMLAAVVTEEASAVPASDGALRRARDDALREYLAWLRGEARIGIAPQFLSTSGDVGPEGSGWGKGR